MEWSQISLGIALSIMVKELPFWGIELATFRLEVDLGLKVSKIKSYQKLPLITLSYTEWSQISAEIALFLTVKEIAFLNFLKIFYLKTEAFI